jgi:hypothetical protein
MLFAKRICLHPVRIVVVLGRFPGVAGTHPASGTFLNSLWLGRQIRLRISNVSEVKLNDFCPPKSGLVRQNLVVAQLWAELGLARNRLLSRPQEAVAHCITHDRGETQRVTSAIL